MRTPDDGTELQIGNLRCKVLAVASNGRAVATAHELSHVVQQRGTIELWFDHSAFFSASNANLRTLLTPGGRRSGVFLRFGSSPPVALGEHSFSAAVACGPSSWLPPGNTKYAVVKLSRA